MFITFHMRSGKSIVVEAESFDSKRSISTDEVVEYKLVYPKDYTGTRITTLCLGQIEAITRDDKRPKS